MSSERKDNNITFYMGESENTTGTHYVLLEKNKEEDRAQTPTTNAVKTLNKKTNKTLEKGTKEHKK